MSVQSMTRVGRMLPMLSLMCWITAAGLWAFGVQGPFVAISLAIWFLVVQIALERTGW